MEEQGGAGHVGAESKGQEPEVRVRGSGQALGAHLRPHPPGSTQQVPALPPDGLNDFMSSIRCLS